MSYAQPLVSPVVSWMSVRPPQIAAYGLLELLELLLD